jgi:predicted enzyme related to lactoylglutathione lyase
MGARIVWCDLRTNDRDKALVFHPELFGWTLITEQAGMGPYTRIHDGRREIGGMAPLFGAPPGAPGSWLPYFGVADCDATAAAAVAAGAQLSLGPFDLPDVGRFAMLRDPEGAELALIAMPAPPPRPEGLPQPGAFCGFTLHARDPEAALAFYAALFAWTIADRAPRLLDGEAPAADVVPLADPSAAPHWRIAVAVRDVDRAHVRAIGLGGNEVSPPADTAEGARQSVITDATGAVLALRRPGPGGW